MRWRADTAAPVRSLPCSLGLEQQHFINGCAKIRSIEENDCGIYFYKPFWALLRDLEPIAIFDSAGVIHTGQGATELMPLCEQVDRKLAFTSAGILGSYLP